MSEVIISGQNVSLVTMAPCRQHNKVELTPMGRWHIFSIKIWTKLGSKKPTAEAKVIDKLH